MSDHDENEEISSVGEGDASPSKNAVFFGAMIMVVVAAGILLFMASGGEDEKEADLEQRVQEEYDTANRKLILPSESRADRDRRSASDTQQQTEVYRSRAARLAAVQGPEGIEPGQNPQESREQAQARQEAEKMWDSRRSADPVIFSKSSGNSEGGGENTRRGRSTSTSRVSGAGSIDYESLTDKIMGNVGMGKGKTTRRDKDQMMDRLQSAQTQGVTASFLQDKPHTIAQGKIIGCILETAMNSSLPGMTRCVLSEDVYSFDGAQKLLPKGSRLVGQYEGGIQHGESRIFVIWTRVITPDGVDVALQSPGTGALGEAGHSAFIDKHFMERFGASALLSIIGSLAATESEGDVRIKGIADSFNDSAEIALEESIRIRPTGHKNQGERIKVFVARDIDFGPVLRLSRANMIR